MWDGIDRRRFPRARYKAIIDLQKKGSPKKISTYTENIGVGGICVIAKEDLGLFSGVNLELDLRNGNPLNIKCSGTIVWVVKKHGLRVKDTAQYDTGIEFIDTNKKDKERINKIVESELKNNPSNRA